MSTLYSEDKDLNRKIELLYNPNTFINDDQTCHIIAHSAELFHMDSIRGRFETYGFSHSIPIIDYSHHNSNTGSAGIYNEFTGNSTAKMNFPGPIMISKYYPCLVPRLTRAVKTNDKHTELKIKILWRGNTIEENLLKTYREIIYRDFRVLYVYDYPPKHLLLFKIEYAHVHFIDYVRDQNGHDEGRHHTHLNQTHNSSGFLI